MTIVETTDRLTPKAARTRERILETALRLFAEKGYHATTLREIAAGAEVSLGLTYRYFAAKEELVIALYRRCADQFAVWVGDELGKGTIAKRYGAAMRADLAFLGAFRDGFAALFQAGLNPDAETAVLGDKVSGVREQVWETFLAVIAGAKDAPGARQSRELATALYAGHLMIILFWLQDRSENQSKTYELIAFAEETLGRVRPALLLPMTARILTKFIRIIGPMFGPLAG
jgi:AcrR family transcriptional regulator